MKNIFRTFLYSAVLLVAFFTPKIVIAQPSALKTLIIKKGSLENIRTAYLHKDKKIESLVIKFLSEADQCLDKKPLSVMDKSIIPPSGDKHDFMSMGPYWWPDSSKKDGLPYIRKDGQRNPEYFKITDQEYFDRIVNDAQILAIAFYLTNDPKYAAKGADVIRVWFLNDDTRMNPNMNHSQYIPGINTGRGIGLIETREMFKVLDAIAILRTSKEWSAENDRKIKKWFEDYFVWITTHKYGLDESKEKNNHGTWYDVQLTSIALFLNKDEFAKKAFEEVKVDRIGTQIEPDGKQPRELARTKSWNYCTMNLSAFMHLALLAEHVNIDLWNYQSTRDGSIRNALDYLLPFALNSDTWKYQDIDGFDKKKILPLVMIAKKKYEDKAYSEWLNKIFAGEAPITLNDLLY